MVVSPLTATFSVRTPRIAGRASPPERPNVKPGDMPSICEISVTLRSASCSAVTAVTDTGISCLFSARRCAVTTISSRPAGLATGVGVPGVCARAKPDPLAAPSAAAICTTSVFLAHIFIVSLPLRLRGTDYYVGVVWNKNFCSERSVLLRLLRSACTSHAICRLLHATNGNNVFTSYSTLNIADHLHSQSFLFSF